MDRAVAEQATASNNPRRLSQVQNLVLTGTTVNPIPNFVFLCFPIFTVQLECLQLMKKMYLL